MHRFLIFGGNEFYSHGGINDLLGTCNSDLMAILRAKNMIGQAFAVDKDDFKVDPEYAIKSTIEWIHVYDTETDEIIHKEGKPFGGYRTVFVGGDPYGD